MDAGHPMISNVRHAVLVCVLSVSAAASAYAALPEGAAAPQFRAPAALAGRQIMFDLNEALKKGPVVVYFYPSAYTNGCNVQARTFAVNHDEFIAAGATVIGVSLDSIERLKEFSADPEFCAGKFPTASDPDGAIAKSFDLKISEGAPGMKDTRGQSLNHGFAERTTFIIGKDGRVVAAVGGLNPKENVTKSLEIIKNTVRS